MTMVPAQNHLSGNLHGGYVGSCGGVGRYRETFRDGDQLMNGADQYYSCLGSDLLVSHMAEDESRTNSLNEEAASSRDEGWLQLSIGGSGGGGGGGNNNKHDSAARRSSGLVELELLPGGGGGGRDTSKHERTPVDPIFQGPRIPASRVEYSAGTSPLFFPHLGSSHFLQQEINWAIRPATAAGPSSSPSTSSASSSFLPLMGRVGTYFGRPLIQFQGSGVDVAGPSSELRIIDPPRRPRSGIWFALKALENQAKEPFLPQISKNYLRIKDGKMTVRLVMKYLVNKLSLDNESEIEIRCRGQHLLPFLTLQHVRDNIWTSSSSRDSLFNLLPDSSTTDHLMVLHYGRIN